MESSAVRAVKQDLFLLICFFFVGLFGGGGGGDSIKPTEIL